MKRLYMRAFWGIDDNSNRILRRKERVKNNINQILKNKHKEPLFFTYVFGKENLKLLMSLGVKNCILIHDAPFKYDLVQEQYRHKLEAIRYAFEEDKCDEMIHLDWDCVPQKPITDEVWNILGKKEAFQANLIQYRREKARWRGKIDSRKIPNGGFVYIRNKTYPQKLIKYWEELRGPSAEPPMAKFVDELMGGWQGMMKYAELFEPDVVKVHRMSPLPDELILKKNVYWIHYQGRG